MCLGLVSHVNAGTQGQFVCLGRFGSSPQTHFGLSMHNAVFPDFSSQKVFPWKPFDIQTGHHRKDVWFETNETGQSGACLLGRFTIKSLACYLGKDNCVWLRTNLFWKFPPKRMPRVCTKTKTVDFFSLSDNNGVHARNSARSPKIKKNDIAFFSWGLVLLKWINLNRSHHVTSNTGSDLRTARGRQVIQPSVAKASFPTTYLFSCPRQTTPSDFNRADKIKSFQTWQIRKFNGAYQEENSFSTW